MRNEAPPAAITAALFLEEFVDGTPWAHIDIAGTMRWPATISGARRRPAAGARLLAELAAGFTNPKRSKRSGHPLDERLARLI